MMAGLSSAGLPLPVQFIGRYFAEAMLFQIDRAWKRKTALTRSIFATSSDAMQPHVFADDAALYRAATRGSAVGAPRC